ncbi:uncharacterized protein LOC110032560 isoform X2 [Phalaenopsis equestris]|uniref:uncharacterized protein LOC110032560 isoform X2 n=1 Tax=Phalaenopsis equestris TaxID=78828 RepID=UPI0009E1FA1F|nr:uncharacterized protein LOC110032560 isoform X2 [Phalaenopsis equestris]
MERAMDSESVIEFLGQVPLLQKLPSSSLRKIADLVLVKHYGSGEYVFREGEVGEGLYIIWDGLAEVSGSVNSEEGNRPEYQLKQHDYFGYDGSVHEVNVIALSELTCLLLPRGNSNLLQPKSIWNADGTPEDFSLVEHILHLEPLEVDLFRGITLPDAPSFRQVFGGQLIGQALAAASKTVDSLKFVHSLHVFFIVAGDNNAPIIYQVHRARDGYSFATRRVEAKQHGNVIFMLLASFKKEEVGFEHQEALMPNVPAPETLSPMELLWEKRLTDPRLPICVVAYASDLIFSGVSLDPHRQKGLKTALLSLDHSMWFHRSVKADDWLLFVIESPSASGGRGFVTGRMFNQKGELIVSLTQEALIRKAKTQNQVPQSKL